EIASLVAIFHFTKLRLKLFGGPNILLGWLGIVVFCLLRIYAGYTFPLGAIVAVLVGVLIAWLMFQLARSVELLSPGLGGQADEAEAKDQEMP
ncbi:MAG TPA: hypothetical protein VHS96_11360, partial [Bacteroidia bacterium]|nr:hypothetical protein [Bacteroidia bacterium]